MAGTTASTVTVASATFSENSTMVTKTMVRACTTICTMPSWNSCVSESTSLVMRVIKRPAFSRVKNSSDSRWRWEKMRTRSEKSRRSPTRPVHAVRAYDATPPTSTDAR